MKRILPLAVFVGLMLCLSTQAGPKGNVNPGVVPPNADSHGYNYAQWSAKHWQWLYSLPTTAHPLFDTAPVSTGQSDHVWFLGGTFTTTEIDGNIVAKITREVSIPSGTSLFFPLVDAEDSNLEEPVPLSEAELRAVANSIADLIIPESLFCMIDGKAMQNLADYRFESPAFTLGPLPADNVIGGTVGASGLAVSDGYFAMLAPLSVGKHTLKFGGSVDLGGFLFIQEITYNITVTPGGK